jgi:hypothetical protein
MKKLFINYQLISFLILIFTVTSCSSGYNSYKKGDYYKACIDAVDKLKSNPKNEKAQFVLSKTYPLAQQQAIREIDNALLQNDQNNYETVVLQYERLNLMADNIYKCPKALEIVPRPTEYRAQLTDARQKAAAQVYEIANKTLNVGTLDQARIAYQQFLKVNEYVPGYKNVLSLIDESRFQATMRIVVEKPRTSLSYQLSADFFSTNLMAEISNAFKNKMIRFYNYSEATNINIIKPHQYLVLNFEDYSIGNVRETKNTIDVKRDSVKVGTATLQGKKVDVYNTVTAKYHTFRREIKSTGVLSVRIYDNQNQLIQQQNFGGEYVWFTTWSSFNGDEKALTKEQVEACNRNAQNPPSNQNMFVEFTKPIYKQAYSYIKSYYNKY